MLAGTGTYTQITAVHPRQEAVWAAAFERDTLDGLFDMLAAPEAIKVLDAAIQRFNTHSEELRPLLDPKDRLGLRGNRGVLESMRRWMADNGGSITGAYEDETNP